jgi:uncharacterized protein
MFGVGGGFLLTPLLIFNGIPAAVAVSSGANQIVASSVSGALAHWRRGAVDMKMGMLLLGGGFLGSLIGVLLFQYLRKLGVIDVVISLAYVALLGSVGSLMLYESARSIWRAGGRRGGAPNRRSHHNWVHGLPFKMRFPRSRLYVSAIPPVALGASMGICASLLGISGGFFLIPAMIYVLRMPSNVVVGTSLLQVVFVMAFTTILQSAANKTVDIVLALFLILGGVVGAQVGAAVGQKLRGDYLRALLALIVLGVGVRLAFELTLTPQDLFSFEILKRPHR